MAAEQQPGGNISVFAGFKHLIDQTIERSNININNNNNNNNNNHDGLSSFDKKFLIQMFLCMISIISIPIMIILFLISSSIGSIGSLSISAIFLCCFCFIGCGNIYWIKKENNGYQQI